VPFTRRSFLAGVAAATTAGSNVATAQVSPVIRISAGYSDLSIEPYLALDGGFFSRAGLTVEVSPFSNAGAIVAAVAGGSLDVGIADTVQVANAVNRGIPLTFFAGGSLYSSTVPSVALCVAKSGPVRTAKDLEQQTIAVIALKSISEASIREWLRINGADATKVKLVEMSYAEMAPALERGTVAAAFIGEPFLTTVKANVRMLGRCYDTVAPEFYVAAFFTTRSWLTNNADAVRRLASALYGVAGWANGHHNESAEILAKYSKMDLDTIRAMNRAKYATSLDVNLMQPVLDIALKYQLIDKRIAAADLVAKVPA
jgi:NitT/TauT family transport system substrate-binding protein